mmetsp:Transcript_6146/g.18393  ORF Transcript_6146/g.18393 Transcript_6146/m.18393 type:complete len:214 (+) Transcript_6146:101-742(+)
MGERGGCGRPGVQRRQGAAARGCQCRGHWPRRRRLCPQRRQSGIRWRTRSPAMSCTTCAATATCRASCSCCGAFPAASARPWCFTGSCVARMPGTRPCTTRSSSAPAGGRASSARGASRTTRTSSMWWPTTPTASSSAPGSTGLAARRGPLPLTPRTAASLQGSRPWTVCQLTFASHPRCNSWPSTARCTGTRSQTPAPARSGRSSGARETAL